MHVRVSGSSFKQNIIKLLGNSSTAVNFSLSEGKLQLQLAGVVIVNKYVDILEVEGEECSVTVTVEQALELLAEDYVVDLNITRDSVEIKQGLFYYIAAKNAEEKVFTKRVEHYECSVSEEAIIKFVHNARAMELVNKELGREGFEVDIYNGLGIVKTDNTMYRAKLPLVNSHLSGEECKKLIKCFTGCNSYHLDSESRVILFKIDSGGSNVAVAYREYRKALFELHENLMRDMVVAVNEIRLEDYSSTMSVICKAYKKLLVEMTVCEMGLLLHVNNAKVQFIVGKDSKPLFTIKMSIAQLNAVNRIFGNETFVQILRGKDKICLKQKNCNSDLIIAGMIY